MRAAREEMELPAKVYGPEAHLTSIVRDALQVDVPPRPEPVVKIQKQQQARLEEQLPTVRFRPENMLFEAENTWF